jgi:hypothetical protein
MEVPKGSEDPWIVYYELLLLHLALGMVTFLGCFANPNPSELNPHCLLDPGENEEANRHLLVEEQVKVLVYR